MQGSSNNLRVGVGRVDITPPLPAECVGFVRRAAPVAGLLAPLTATVVVFEDVESDKRIAIVAVDLMSLSTEQCSRLRETVGARIDADPNDVLVNYSHSHATPYSAEGMPKIGGNQRVVYEKELAYIAMLPWYLDSASTLALGDLAPARVASGATRVEGIAVNRRERTPEGRTILGWNPSAPYDPKLTVVRIDGASGIPRVIIASFPCHPVVVGPDDQNVGPDYPGALRALVERTTGATCVFLAGAAGNVLPLQGFHGEAGPEVAFGERLGYSVMEMSAKLETTQTEIIKLPYGSVTPISLYRKVPIPEQPPQPINAVAEWVSLPLKPLPSRDDLVKELEGYRGALNRAQVRGADAVELNPLDYHVIWAERALARIDSGEDIETSVPAFVQALRVGELAIAAVPGEAFNEYAVQVEAASPAPETLFLGYSNGAVSYFPTADEYQFGGYEPGYAHHNTLMLNQVAPDVEGLLVDGCTRLVASLF